MHPRPLPFALLALTLAFSVAAGGCASAPPPPSTYQVYEFAVKGPQGAVLDQIRSDAIANGLRIAGETADSVHVDFGVERVEVPIPIAGLLGTHTEVRRTELHTLAIYRARPRETGSQVTLLTQPTYFHPDLGAWLVAPPEVARALPVSLRRD